MLWPASLRASTWHASARGLDKYGRTLGACLLGRQDVNAWMVRQGYAWAFVKYSTSYVREEAQARAEHVGIWQGEATPPWDYREQRWARAEPQAPQGCAIKGNVTAHGKIYHMPWSPWYAQIKMDLDKGGAGSAPRPRQWPPAGARSICTDHTAWRSDAFASLPVSGTAKQGCAPNPCAW